METVSAAGATGRKSVLVVCDVHEHAQGDLLVIVQATDLRGLGLGLGQGRQQQRRQDGDDGDHDQQLDQGEAWWPDEAGRCFAMSSLHTRPECHPPELLSRGDRAKIRGGIVPKGRCSVWRTELEHDICRSPRNLSLPLPPAGVSCRPVEPPVAARVRPCRLVAAVCSLKRGPGAGPRSLAPPSFASCRWPAFAPVSGALPLNPNPRIEKPRNTGHERRGLIAANSRDGFGNGPDRLATSRFGVFRVFRGFHFGNRVDR